MRVGVIGLGMSGQTHVDALRQVGAQVFGADPSPAARERAVEHALRCFADYREMVAVSQLDGVVIATPPRTHCAISVACLEAGLGVLCEQPLALTLEECETIVAAARSAQRPFQVGFCHRFQPQVQALKGLLASGSLGEPILLNVAFIHGLTQEGREWITHASTAGGGVLFDSGSHAIDLFRFLVGGVDEAHGQVAPSSGRVEDSAVLCLRAGATLGTVTLSWKVPPWQGLVEVIGSNGRARVEYGEDRVTLRTRLGEAPWRSMRTPYTSRFVGQMRTFVARLRGQAVPTRFATAEDGLEVTRTILKVYDFVS